MTDQTPASSKALVVASHRDINGDHVLRLLVTLSDADTGTEAVLRSFKLPESAYVEALEGAEGSAGRAVAILKRISAVRVLSDGGGS